MQIKLLLQFQRSMHFICKGRVLVGAKLNKAIRHSVYLLGCRNCSTTLMHQLGIECSGQKLSVCALY